VHFLFFFDLPQHPMGILQTSSNVNFKNAEYKIKPVAKSLVKNNNKTPVLDLSLDIFVIQNGV